MGNIINIENKLRQILSFILLSSVPVVLFHGFPDPPAPGALLFAAHHGIYQLPERMAACS